MTTWPVVPLKAVSDITLGKMVQPEMRGEADVEAPYLRAAHVQPNGLLIQAEEKAMWFSPKELRQLTLRHGDVVVVEGGAGYGRSAYLDADYDGWGFQNSIIRLRPRKELADGRFLDYMLQGMLISGETALAASVATIPHFSAEKVAAVHRPMPDMVDQRAIADFLDRETAQIDAMIEAQRDLVVKLEERKAAMSTAIIWGASAAETGSQHVIDPAPNVPASWRVLRNKWVYDESLEVSVTGEGEMLSVSHITGVTPRSEKVVNMTEAESTVGYRVVRPDDIVINTLWGWMGALGVSTLEGIVSPAYGVYRPKTSEANPVFMHHLYRSLPYVCEIQRRSTGIWSSRLRLYPKVFLDMPTVLPPREEQDEIAARLAQSQARMDAMIDAANDTIALMKERRSALISAAVTGRIDPHTGKEYRSTKEAS